MDRITEEILLEALRGEAGLLDAAPSAIEFKTAITDIAHMKLVVGVAEKIHDVKMSVADPINKYEWRSAVRQRLNFVPRYGRHAVEAVLEGIWPEDFRGRVVTEARFREISGDHDLLNDLWKRCRRSRQQERRNAEYRGMDGCGLE